MSTDNQFLAQRREKAEALAESGINLYANTFKPANRIIELLPTGERLEPEEKDPSGARYSVAGRIMAMRKFGKAAFFSIADSTERTQVYVRRDKARELLPEQVARFDALRARYAEPAEASS